MAATAEQGQQAPITDPNETVGFLIVKVSRLLRRAFQDCMETCDLTYSQARTLMYVARNQGVRQVDLAEIQEIKPITLARSLDQLQEQGLVDRRPDPLDRRAHRIYLSDNSTAQLENVEKNVSDIREVMLSGLSKKDYDTLLAALGHICDNLHAMRIKENSD